ncbi:MAG: ribosome recycling factor [Chlamydiales bacterium]|jgi:ribosome recycling factor|nr:ribosome recycling factor [Chlamydiales bacterium]
MNAVEQAKIKMNGALEHLKNELKNIRTGRANPAILDGVRAEVYGSEMKLKELANVSVAPDGRQLIVTPFDKATTPFISKGIEKANLNLNPQVDGHLIRIPVPPMDENTRKEMAKLAKKKGEEAKVGIRQIRQESNNKLKQQKTDSQISEDDQKRGEKKVQELTDNACTEIDKMVVAKEKEIVTI